MTTTMRIVLGVPDADVGEVMRFSRA